MDKEIRRRQSILSITGQGVILFGLWGIVKLNLLFLLDKGYYFHAMGMSGAESYANIALFALWCILMIFSIIGLLVRIYIGRAAIFEANYYHKKSFYGLAVIMTILSTMSLITSIVTLSINEHILDFIASILVDLTSLYMMIELISSTRKLRILRGEKRSVKHQKTM
jgi:hypothetical protein